jgi:hypothetical protein
MGMVVMVFVVAAASLSVCACGVRLLPAARQRLAVSCDSCPDCRGAVFRHLACSRCQCAVVVSVDGVALLSPSWCSCVVSSLLSHCGVLSPERLRLVNPHLVVYVLCLMAAGRVVLLLWRVRAVRLALQGSVAALGEVQEGCMCVCRCEYVDIWTAVASFTPALT